MLSFEKFLTSAHISYALVIALEDLYRRLLPKYFTKTFMASFINSGVRNPIISFGLINYYYYASALSLFIGTRPCKCFMSVCPDCKQNHRLLLSSTRTLTTSVKTATATALAIVTHIYNMYEGFVLWLIVLGSPGFPSVSCPRHALNLLGLMWLKSVFRGQRYYE